MAVTLSQIVYKHKRREHFGTGHGVFDEKLNAEIPGLAPQSLTEFSGPPGSGKSTIALLLMLDALKSGQSILWLSCGLRPFPLQRLQELQGYSPAYESKITVIPVESLEQLRLIDVHQKMVVLDHYDSLISMIPKAKRGHAVEFLLNGLNAWAESNCVICTSAMVSRVINRGEQRKLTPTLVHGELFKNVRRVSLLRDAEGILCTNTGVTFSINDLGLTELDTCAVKEEITEGLDFVRDYDDPSSSLASQSASQSASQLAWQLASQYYASSPPELDHHSTTLDSVEQAVEDKNSIDFQLEDDLLDPPTTLIAPEPLPNCPSNGFAVADDTHVVPLSPATDPACKIMDPVHEKHDPEATECLEEGARHIPPDLGIEEPPAKQARLDSEDEVFGSEIPNSQFEISDHRVI